MRDIRNSKVGRGGAAIEAAPLFLRILLCAFVLWSPPTVAGGCADGGGGVTATRFFPNADGTVTDLESGLTWQRCSVGMRWDGTTCLGEARRLSWTEARQQEVLHWRLPRLNELALLADRYCASPRIDVTIFPRTPATLYWTATPQRGTEDRIFALGFDRRGVVALPQGESAAVRLVSGRED